MIITVQVDLDGLWVLKKALGTEGDPAEDTLYEIALRRALQFFAKFGITATFFVIGRDLEIGWKRSLLKDVLIKGHEIASHGFSHSYLTHCASRHKTEEIWRSSEIIKRELGVSAQGFRAPGYAVDEETLEVIHEAGFVYDSSVLPTRWLWALSLLQRMRSNEKSAGYTGGNWGNAPNRPYFHMLKQGSLPLLEIPVTVSPIGRLPIHFSYLEKYLSPGIFEFFIKKIATREDFLNFVFHLIDFVDRTEDDRVNRLLCLSRDWKKKCALIENVLTTITKRGRTVATRDAAETIRACNTPCLREETHDVITSR
ncbi:MAG: polysaccharide deacetylase family protein [Candidatus Omnitrophica bacterium]|nr:polysaccharide deacetylase family protein [Candidatus Omnitrophota bacterium]